MAGVLNAAVKLKDPMENLLASKQAAPVSTKKTVQPVTPGAPTAAAPAATPSAPAATPAAPAAPTYAPAKVEVNPATDTVQGQVTNIIDKNSDIMKLAETRGRQQANSRGLLNSSMAVQAGQAAVLDAAVPMAAQDAATSMRAKEINVGAENEFSLQGLRGEQAKQLEEISNKNSQLLQASQSAAQIMSQTSASISNILANPDIPLNQKEQMIAREVQLLENGLAITGAIPNLNLKGLLKFPKSGKASTALKSEPPKNPKVGDIWVKDDGTKMRYISLSSKPGSGEWKPV